ncbi:tetratricopeptide repeat protein [Massilia horti]|uniref:Tetratricopeptide repeat protein n=1 Tax=Massilia horti TaxID=2562153 RepID=A0A4Y9SX51_9BURK|nr:tetratricopeptide repeat protein [Massilia horti]TFW30117.1 tetratricopeptide repeat protein [Massilia horti]
MAQAALAQYETELEGSRRALVAVQDAAAHAKDAQRNKSSAKELRTARGRVNADFADVTHMQGYISELHHGMNDLAQAEGMYVLALAQYTKMPVPDTIRATRIKTDLAVLYRMRGEPARALTLQQEALATMLDMFGPDHPDVRETKDELALIYRALKQYAAAEPLYVNGSPGPNMVVRRRRSLTTSKPWPKSRRRKAMQPVPRAMRSGTSRCGKRRGAAARPSCAIGGKADRGAAVQGLRQLIKKSTVSWEA